MTEKFDLTSLPEVRGALSVRCAHCDQPHLIFINEDQEPVAHMLLTPHNGTMLAGVIQSTVDGDPAPEGERRDH